MGFERIEYIVRNPSVPPGATVTQSLNALAASVASTDLRKYCKAVVYHVRARIDGTAAGATAWAAMAMGGTVSLTYKGGALCQNLDARRLHISNCCEGMWPNDKRATELFSGAIAAADTQVFDFTGVLAFAPAACANDTRQARSVDGMMPVSHLGQHSTFTLTLPALVGGVFDLGDTGYVVTAIAIMHTSREKYAPRPTEIRFQTYAADPLTLDGELQKIYSLSIMALDYSTIAGAGVNAAVPVIKCDELPISDTATLAEYQLARAVERNDAQIYQAGALLNLQVLHLIDPFMSDRLTEYAAGNKWTVDGLRAAAAEDLVAVYRRFTKLSAGDFASWCAMEGLGTVDKSRVLLGGKRKDELNVTLAESIGIPLSVDSEKKA